MQLTLTKCETNSIVGARLLSAARQKDVHELEEQIGVLAKKRDQIMREVNEHAAEVFAAIGEDYGHEIPLDKVKFAKKRDGTSTIEWPDVPAPKLVEDEDLPEDAHVLPPVTEAVAEPEPALAATV